MAKKVGKCINIDCDNYKKVVEVAAGEEFECPLCHQPLEEVSGGGKPGGGGDDDGKKKLIAIIAAAVVLVGGGTGLYFGLSGDDKETAPASKIETPTDSIAKDTTAVDTVATPVKEEPAVKEEPKVEEKKAEEKKTTKPAPTQKNGYGTVNLGYGRYTGDLKNGQPHGHGTITYTQSHKIVNSKDFVANPGDTFEGDFREGRISSIGYWTHDGNQTAVKP